MRALAGIAIGFVLATACAPAQAAGPARSLDWSDLQSFAAVAQEPDRPIAITGFLLPVDRDGDLAYEFMLVPWVGACSHTAPPPPDQLILVHPPEPYRIGRLYEPVTITGRLERRESLSQFFVVDGIARVQSGYAMSAVTVVAATPVGNAPLAPGAHTGAASPWKFLKR